MSDKQQELFEADVSWFHVFKEMVKSKEIAQMQPSSVVVYLVIKAFTSWQDGRAFPSLDKISEYSGMSLAQVKRCLDELIKRGHITKAKLGKKNVYTLREKLVMTDAETGVPAAVATWDYAPMTATKAVLELKNMLVTGDFNGAKIINIERLYLQQGDNNTQNNPTLHTDFGKLTKAEKDAYLRYYAEAKARREAGDDLSTDPE